MLTKGPRGIFQKLVRFSNKWWYPWLIALLSALDAFVFFIPNEAILLPAVIARPKRWLVSTLLMTLGSALGAVAFAAAVSKYGVSLIQHFFPHLLDSKSWLDSERILQRHSAWGLALISLSPFPQHAAVAIAGIAHVSLWIVFLSVFFGRSCKYLLISWLTVRTSRIFQKNPKRAA